MREFSKDEIIVAKCPVCGCRNKVYARLLDKNSKECIGYTMKCCNCGKYSEFITNHVDNGNYPLPSYHDTIQSNQHCIQLSYCPNKDCPLYGTCKDCYWDKHPCFDDDSDFDTKSDVKSNRVQHKVQMELLPQPKFL